MTTLPACAFAPPLHLPPSPFTPDGVPPSLPQLYDYTSFREWLCTGNRLCPRTNVEVSDAQIARLPGMKAVSACQTFDTQLHCTGTCHASITHSMACKLKCSSNECAKESGEPFLSAWRIVAWRARRQSTHGCRSMVCSRPPRIPPWTSSEVGGPCGPPIHVYWHRTGDPQIHRVTG